MAPFLHRLAPSTMEENPLWLIVLCDMMTNLMLFFLVMYVLAQQGPQAQRRMLQTFDVKALVEDPRQRKAEDAIKEFREEDAGAAIQELLKRAGLAGQTEVSVSEHHIRVRLRNHVLFKTAQAALAPESARPLQALAGVLQGLPNEIVVEGHTDDIPVVGGPYRSNWELSVARSYAVIERLVLAGVAPARLVAAGYGEYRPLVENSGSDSRSRNRRVEVVIVRDKAAAHE